jgi:hypothetical protein
MEIDDETSWVIRMAIGAHRHACDDFVTDVTDLASDWNLKGATGEGYGLG